jgi:hypothetical protein
MPLELENIESINFTTNRIYNPSINYSYNETGIYFNITRNSSQQLDEIWIVVKGVSIVSSIVGNNITLTFNMTSSVSFKVENLTIENHQLIASYKDWTTTTTLTITYIEFSGDEIKKIVIGEITNGSSIKFSGTPVPPPDNNFFIMMIIIMIVSAISVVAIIVAIVMIRKNKGQDEILSKFKNKMNKSIEILKELNTYYDWVVETQHDSNSQVTILDIVNQFDHITEKYSYFNEWGINIQEFKNKIRSKVLKVDKVKTDHNVFNHVCFNLLNLMNAITDYYQMNKAEKLFDKKELTQQQQELQSLKEMLIMREKIYILNIFKYFILIKKEGGITLFHMDVQNVEWITDAHLLGSFVSAISSLGKELQFEDNLTTVQFGEYQLFLETSQNLMGVFVLSDTPPNFFKWLSQKTIHTIENDFQEQIKYFNGNVTIFEKVAEIIQLTFNARNEYVIEGK